MSKLTEAEWQKVTDETHMKLTHLIATRAEKMNEWNHLYSHIRELSQQIIETEGLLANLQWSKPRGRK